MNNAPDYRRYTIHATSTERVTVYRNGGYASTTPGTLMTFDDRAEATAWFRRAKVTKLSTGKLPEVINVRVTDRRNGKVLKTTSTANVGGVWGEYV